MYHTCFLLNKFEHVQKDCTLRSKLNKFKHVQSEWGPVQKGAGPGHCTVDPPPVDRMTDIHGWQHNLPATSLADCNKYTEASPIDVYNS